MIIHIARLLPMLYINTIKGDTIMKIRQLLKATKKVLENKELKVKRQSQTNDRGLMTITDKDFTTWLKHIRYLADNKKQTHDEFIDNALYILDNDPKLSAASERRKSSCVNKLWVMQQKLEKEANELASKE